MLLISIGLAVAAVAAVVVVNRNTVFRTGAVLASGNGAIGPAPREISVATWNVGYGGLGRASDFVADGGTHYRPPSADAVDDNLAGISNNLDRIQADVYFLQELALASPLNYGRDVLQVIRKSLPHYGYVFDPELRSRLLPSPVKLVHGAATFSRLKIHSAWRQNITSEETYYLGLFRRNYRLLVARLPCKGTDKEWVLINIHLAAFDDDADLRRRQLDDVFTYARAQHDEGHYVIIGGDWNLEFVKSSFPHKTAEQFLFWIHPFPHESVPDGWNVVFDKTIPSVRTVHKPYEPGDNYVTTIDGFVTSPNVGVNDIRTIDTSFEFTDHQPVLASFTARD